MSCDFVEIGDTWGFFCTPSLSPGREPKMKMQAGELQGYCDMEPEIFKNLGPNGIVTIYDDGAGIWGDFEGSWEKKFYKKSLKLIKVLVDIS